MGLGAESRRQRKRPITLKTDPKNLFNLNIRETKEIKKWVVSQRLCRHEQGFNICLSGILGRREGTGLKGHLKK